MKSDKHLELAQVIELALLNKSLFSVTFSSLKKGDVCSINIRQVEIKENILYHINKNYQSRSESKNVNAENILLHILPESGKQFKHLFIRLSDCEMQWISNRKGEWTLRSKKEKQSCCEKKHNRTKKYLLPEGQPIPFLIHLGIMNEKGTVLPKKRDKFVQINHFLEHISSLIQHMETKNSLSIIDCGCGKAYLTFALYYYLNQCLGIDAHIRGVDIKKDVIADCVQLKNALEYTNLSFEVGDIKDVQKNHVDMLIALHACNQATDFALEKAVEWGVQILFVAPCCQQELLQQIHNKEFSAILRHGIMKERFSALLTDALRAELLQSAGYKTQIIEFVDFEHSPKNVALVAIKAAQKSDVSPSYRHLCELFNVSPSLEKLLCKKIL